MNVPDAENLDERCYFHFSDTWKHDWNKGVQVPINCGKIETPKFRLNPILNESKPDAVINSKMPIKYLCPIEHKLFNKLDYVAYRTPERPDCQYDLDEADSIWLDNINQTLNEKLTSSDFEHIIEHFELQSHSNFVHQLKKLKNYEIEFDADIICDVCREPDSEPGNEMVFCDGCNICVHQACYGIDKVPEGSWLCSTCTHGGSLFKPECLLCPNKEGIMKPTRNARHWCHVSCALWMPEVKFGNEVKMEPIVNIQLIPQFRWNMICGLCKIKHGCCVKCEHEGCDEAFHITCAFKNSLTLETRVCGDNSRIEFRAFCLSHGKCKKQTINKNTANIIDQNDIYDSEETMEQPLNLKSKQTLKEF